MKKKVVKIPQERLVVMPGPIDYGALRDVVPIIMGLSRRFPTKEIFLQICSSGGIAAAGFCFYDTFRIIHPKVNLVTIGSGELSSVALIVWAAGRRRLLTKHTTVFVHEARQSVEGVSDVTELKGATRYLEMTQGHYTDILGAISGGKLSEDRLTQMLQKERVISPKEMVELGLAHEVI